MSELGFERVGMGPQRVIVLNDWTCDTSTWDAARPYLDVERFAWVFADLRGYGRSIERTGAFSLVEGANDVLELADDLGWARFAVVGHSMSSLVALHLAQHHVERIDRVVVLTPPPPTGFGADEAMLAGARGVALGDDAARTVRFAGRLSPGWAAFKAARWRATANPDAAASYVAMFARDGLPEPTLRIRAPVLAITGEQDVEPMRSAHVTRVLSPLCDRLVVTPLADVGHYPMQEMPPRTVALVEQFLGG